MSLRISDVEDKLDTGNIDTETEFVARKILAAINDWPKPVDTFEEYEGLLRPHTDGDVTKDSLTMANKRLNVIRDAWKGESMSELLEVFSFFPEGASFKSIIELIRTRLNL